MTLGRGVGYTPGLGCNCQVYEEFATGAHLVTKLCVEACPESYNLREVLLIAPNVKVSAAPKNSLSSLPPFSLSFSFFLSLFFSLFLPRLGRDAGWRITLISY